MTEVIVTTGAIRSAKLQSKWHQQQTNIQFFQARCPSCRPTNSVKALKGKFPVFCSRKTATLKVARPRSRSELQDPDSTNNLMLNTNHLAQQLVLTLRKQTCNNLHIILNLPILSMSLVFLTIKQHHMLILIFKTATSST